MLMLFVKFLLRQFVISYGKLSYLGLQLTESKACSRECDLNRFELKMIKIKLIYSYLEIMSQVSLRLPHRRLQILNADNLFFRQP